MWALLYIHTALSAAFLEDALPLKLISITPSQGDPTRLSGSDALTVVFSRPVIALGSDFSAINTSVQGGLNLDPSMVPFHLVDSNTGEVLNIKGKTRWVTTFIARFDGDANWATDLSFKVVVNPKLRTFDGVPIKLPAPEANFTTDPLQLCVSNVRSPLASNATKDMWRPYVSGSTIPEVPDDGEIELGFSYPVVRSMLAQALKLRTTSDSSELQFTLGDCQPTPYSPYSPYGSYPTYAPYSAQAGQAQAVNCVAVKPLKLVHNTQYELYIPAGTKYSSEAGSLANEVKTPFSGLLPFNFAVENLQWATFSYTQYDLALRHGLAAGVTVGMIRQQLALTDKTNKGVPFTLTLVDSNIRITAAFQPQTTYTLTIRGQQNGATAVKDVFGQPMQSQTITWNTSPTPAYMVSPDGYLVFEKSQFTDTKWSVLMRGDPTGNSHSSFALAPVPVPKVAEALGYLDYSGNKYPAAGLTAIQGTDPSFQVVTLSLPTTPLFLRLSSSWSNYYTGSMTSITDLAVSVLTDYDGIVVWVTRMSNGENIENAAVKIFDYTSTWNSNPPSHLIASGTTDKDGLVRLTVADASTRYNMRVLASFNGDATMVLNVGQNPYVASDFTAQMVTDRAVYKPGDTVYIKVYARSEGNNFTWALPQAGAYALTAVWKSGNSDSMSQTNVPVTWSATWGTWSTSLVIPADTTYGNKYLSIQATGPNSRSVGATSITIADPRRPTATMTLTSDATLYRLYNDSRRYSMPIKATVLTGTGDPISGAGVSVTWNLLGYTNTTSGVVVLTTEDSGVAQYDFDLAQELVNNGNYPSIQPQATLTLTATWVGPTGELITSSLAVNADYTEWRLMVTPSIPTPLPGWNFGIYVDVKGKNGVEVKNQPVSVSLQELDDSSKPVGTILNRCRATSGNPAIQCLNPAFVMAKARRYQLVASVTDDLGYTLTQTSIIGQTANEWAQNPLGGFDSVDFRMDKESYKLGDTAKLVFWNPFPRGTLLVRYGNRGGKRQFQVPNVLQGSNSVNILVDPAFCTKGCSLAAILSIPRTLNNQSSSAFRLPVDLPISLLFDPLAPRAFTGAGVQINVVEIQENLSVNLTLTSAKVEPGSSVDLSVNVFNSKHARVRSEIAVFVVDQAFLDVQPHPLSPLPSTFTIDRSDNFQTQSSTSNLVTYKGYAATIAAFQRRTLRNPWIYPNWQTNYPWGRADVDIPDDDYLKQFSSRLADFGSSGSCSMSDFSGISHSNMYGGDMYYNPMMMTRMEVHVPLSMGATTTMAAAPSPTMASRSLAMDMSAAPMAKSVGDAYSSPVPASTGVDIPVRSQFETTPLFVGSFVVPATGPGKITIKLPGNIGKFSVRAYAVDSSSHFGAAETFLTAEKPLNLQSLLPRIARTGDKFECGVTVAGGDSTFDSDVTVTVQALDEGLHLGATQQKVVRVKGTTPVQVRFDMSSVALGTSSLRFTASSEGGASGSLTQDGLEDHIPVLALQDSVFVATSMAITAGSTTPWNEGIAFPPAVPGSGNLTLSAGVGRYPAIVSLSGMLLTPTQEDQLDADLLVSRILTNALLDAYQTSTSSPNSVVTTMSSLIPQAQALLNRYTDSNVGLRWSDRYTVRQTDTVDISLNSYAIYADIRAGNVIPSSMTSQWHAALGAGIASQVQDALSNGWTWSDYYSLSRVFLALGPQWIPDASDEVKQLLSLDNLLSHFNDLDLGGKASVALIQLIHGGITNGDNYVNDAIGDMISYTRVQGRTAYIATAAGGASAASSPVQSDCLSVLSLKQYSHPYVEKIANYVAQGNSVNAGCFYSFSSRSSALGSLALSDYDAAHGTTKPNVAFKVVGASVPILQATFSSPTSPVATLEKSWTSLPTTKTTDANGQTVVSPAPLSFVASGTGEVSVAVGLSFVPAQLSADPIYRGIYVEKIIQATHSVTGDAIGAPIQAASFGQIVQVTLQITTPDDLWQVEVSDLVPGGLEPVDNNLANAQPTPVNPPNPYLTSRLPMSRGKLAVPMPTRWVWYNPFESPQTLTDRVTWFSNYLRAGTYSVTYKAVAVTPGTWQLPPAKASVASQPEVMGLSSAGAFLVTETAVTPQAITQADLPSLKTFTPKECPSACTNSQFCNLRTGVCEDVGVKIVTSTNSLQACGVLKQVTVTWPAENTVRLAWTAPAAGTCNTARYRIEYKDATEATWHIPKGEAITGTRVVIMGLDQSRVWRFRITPLEQA